MKTPKQLAIEAVEDYLWPEGRMKYTLRAIVAALPDAPAEAGRCEHGVTECASCDFGQSTPPPEPRKARELPREWYLVNHSEFDPSDQLGFWRAYNSPQITAAGFTNVHVREVLPEPPAVPDARKEAGEMALELLAAYRTLSAGLWVNCFPVKFRHKVEDILSHAKGQTK